MGETFLILVGPHLIVSYGCSRKGGKGCFLFCLQQLRSYRSEIETQYLFIDYLN